MGNNIAANDDVSVFYNPELADPLHYVYTYLPVKDLYSLSCVSKRFYRDIEIYCRRIYLKMSSEISLNELLEKQLLPDKTDILAAVSNNDYSYKRLFAIYDKWSRLQRRSISALVSAGDGYITWLGDTRYMVNEYDKSLGRLVVRLKEVCWLDMRHTIKNVKPGRYIAKWRMDITKGVWPSGNITTIWVSWEDSDGGGERKIGITPEKFKELKKNLKRLQPGNSIQLSCAWASNYEKKGGWFDFCFEEISLSSMCNVCFGLTNLHQWWKQGMRWDYIELTPV